MSWQCIDYRVLEPVCDTAQFRATGAILDWNRGAEVEPVVSPRGTVRFGLFEADLAAGELRKRGRKVPLQEQPWQVLCALLESPGVLVTREELQ